MGKAKERQAELVHLCPISFRLELKIIITSTDTLTGCFRIWVYFSKNVGKNLNFGLGFKFLNFSQKIKILSDNHGIEEVAAKDMFIF